MSYLRKKNFLKIWVFFQLCNKSYISNFLILFPSIPARCIFLVNNLINFRASLGLFFLINLSTIPDNPPYIYDKSTIDRLFHSSSVNVFLNGIVLDVERYNPYFFDDCRIMLLNNTFYPCTTGEAYGYKSNVHILIELKIESNYDSDYQKKERRFY